VCGGVVITERGETTSAIAAGHICRVQRLDVARPSRLRSRFTLSVPVFSCALKKIEQADTFQN